MVTVPQYEQQLQQRARDIESAQRNVEGFDPRLAQTQQQLRAATPTSQVSVRQLEAGRAVMKQSALQDIELEKQEQNKLQLEFAPVKARYEMETDFQKGYKLGIKGGSPIGLNKVQKLGYKAARQETKALTSRSEKLSEIRKTAEELGVRFDPSNIKGTIAEINDRLGFSSVESYSIAQEGGIPITVTSTLTKPQYLEPIMVRDLQRVKITSQDVLPRQDSTDIRNLPKIPSALTYLDKTLFTMPRTLEIIPSGDLRQMQRSTIISNRLPVVTGPTAVTGQDILNVPSAVVKAFGDIGLTGFARTVGGDFSIAGPPELSLTIPQRRSLTSAETGLAPIPQSNIPSQSIIDFAKGEESLFYVSPEMRQAVAAGPFPSILARKQGSALTPQTFGKIGETVATVGAYFVPGLGPTLATSDVILGSKQLFVDENPYQKIDADEIINAAKAEGRTIGRVAELNYRDQVKEYNKQVEAANKAFRFQGGARLGAGVAYFGTRAFQAARNKELQARAESQKPKVEILGSEQRNRLVGEIKRDLQGRPDIKFDSQRLSSTRAYMAKVETVRGPRYFEAVEFGKVKGVPGDELFGRRTLYIRELDQSGRVISNSIGFSLEKAGVSNTDIFSRIIRQEKAASFFDRLLNKQPKPQASDFLERIQITKKGVKDVGPIRFKVIETSADVRALGPTRTLGRAEARNILRDEGFTDIAELARRKVQPFAEREFAKSPLATRGSAIEYFTTKGGQRFFNANQGANIQSAISTKTIRVGPSRLTQTDVTDFIGKGATVKYPTSLNADIRSISFGAGVSRVPGGSSGGATRIFPAGPRGPGLFGQLGDKVSQKLGSVSTFFAKGAAPSAPVQAGTLTPAVAIQESGKLFGQSLSAIPSTVPAETLGAFAKSIAVGVPAQTTSPLFGVGAASQLFQPSSVGQRPSLFYRTTPLQILSERTTQTMSESLAPRQLPDFSSRSGSGTSQSFITPQSVVINQELAQSQIPVTIPRQSQQTATTEFTGPEGTGGRRRRRQSFALQEVILPRRPRNIKVITEIKRRGKFVPVSGPVSPERGVEIGIGGTRTTIARTFRLKPLGGVRPEEIQLNRRPSVDIYRSPRGRKAQPLTFVERKPYALRGSPGAVREIVSARRGGKNAIKFI